VVSRTWNGNDSKCRWIFAFGRIGREWLFSGLFSRMVATTRLSGLSLLAIYSFTSRTTFSIIFSFISSLCSDVSRNRSIESDIFSNESVLFANQSVILSDESQLFSDES
jgi:hypothetical protein